MSFNFGNANKQQIEAIIATNGPVLITAGPGTGKTFTLVQRAIYLIQECGIQPEEIFIPTFTEKAAKELVTRITNELAARDISVNVNEMYVGTFHSICLRIIKEHLEYSLFKKNYRMLDTFDQQYMVFQNLNRFKRITNLDGVIKSSGWRTAKEICEYANNLSEELVTPEALRQDQDGFVVALGNMLAEYQMLLNEGNLIDFATIQTECFRILKENPAILEELQEKIKYIMVDEYQDTNYIQEQIVFLLGKTHNNICVVGDDDQGLYRFRGATIRNILEFPMKFSKDECRIVALTENYRSDSDIVKEIYFTGMFTSNQGDLSVHYYDPESKRVRQYYPDFLALMEDGTYQLIEVKGDHMIDNKVVLAKKEAAEEMSIASGMQYLIYPSSKLMKQNVLDDPQFCQMYLVQGDNGKEYEINIMRGEEN